MITKKVFQFVIYFTISAVLLCTTTTRTFADNEVKKESNPLKRELVISNNTYWVCLVDIETGDIIDVLGFYWAGIYIPITSSGPDELLIIQEVDTINSSPGIDSIYEHAFPHYQDFLYNEHL